MREIKTYFMYDKIKKIIITMNPFNRQGRDKNSEYIIYAFYIANSFNTNTVH